MEVLGIDVGFGFTKATNGKESITFKSVFGEATDIQFQMNMGDNSFSKNLHVTIDDKSYFIGEFAEQQSNIKHFTLDKEKLITEFVKILALSAVGVLSEKYVPINIVSGLPVGYLKRYYKNFVQILKGHHEVTYHKLGGNDISRKININEVRMLPQPVGSIFHLLMSEKGQISNKELKKQKVGVVDIGFRTTDFAILDQMHYVDRGSSTIDTGISRSFIAIANKLRKDTGVSVELYRMYKAVETGSIKIRGQEYDISSVRDQAYSHLAGATANELNRLWTEDWDIDTIILTGGGSRELAKYLQPLIDGNVIPVENNIDARLNNVHGFFKYGKFKWGVPASEISSHNSNNDPKR